MGVYFFVAVMGSLLGIKRFEYALLLLPLAAGVVVFHVLVRQTRHYWLLTHTHMCRGQRVYGHKQHSIGTVLQPEQPAAALTAAEAVCSRWC